MAPDDSEHKEEDVDQSEKPAKPAKKKLKVKKDSELINNQAVKKVRTKNKEINRGPYSEAFLKAMAEKKRIDERLIDLSSKEELNEQKSVQPDEVTQRDERIYYLTGKGKKHPVHELHQMVRTVLINSGFNELPVEF